MSSDMCPAWCSPTPGQGSQHSSQPWECKLVATSMNQIHDYSRLLLISRQICISARPSEVLVQSLRRALSAVGTGTGKAKGRLRLNHPTPGHAKSAAVPRKVLMHSSLVVHLAALPLQEIHAVVSSGHMKSLWHACMQLLIAFAAS